MFPLKTDQFPATSADLAYRLNESLREVFQLARDPVVVREAAYPHLSTLTVSLDGAAVKGRPPALPSVPHDGTPALTVDSFSANGSDLAVGPATIDFRLEASKVELSRAKDGNGHIVLLLQKAAEGRIDI